MAVIIEVALGRPFDYTKQNDTLKLRLLDRGDLSTVYILPEEQEQWSLGADPT
jgi:hypothetical protein